MNNVSSRNSSNHYNNLLKPKYDVVFQSLFSNKHKEETGYFISAILGRKMQILQVDTEVSQVREFPQEKIGRMDLLAHTDNDELIHIEIQLVNYHNTVSRLIYSTSQNVSKQLIRGNNYGKISKTITIGLLDYNLKELSDIKDMHTIYHLRDCDDKLLTDLVELHIIEMTKVRYEYEKDPNNLLAKWILFILDPNQMEVKSIMNENDEINKTAHTLENISDDEDIRKRAEILERWELEEKWNKASVFEYGKEEGAKEGETRGAKSKALDIAKKMLEKSIDIDTICEVTGLSKDEISN